MKPIMAEQDAPRVSIVIVSWNSAAYLGRCLASLDLQSYRDFEVIVVDNGSTDGSAQDLVGAYRGLRLRVEKLGFNRGYAAANNIGAGLATGYWLALLNPDAFAEPSWLEQLIRAGDSEPRAFFASRQLEAERPELLDGDGDAYHISGLAWRQGYGMPVPPPRGLREVFSACAAAAMFPRGVFLAAGGFDESYFAYHEDVDLGFRLRLSGLKCMLAPEAVVHHIGYGSSGRRSRLSTYYGHRNLVWTYVKDMPDPWFWLYLPLHLAMTFISLAYFTLEGQGVEIWRAKIDALRGLSAALGKRGDIQRRRKVSTAEIRRMMMKSLIAPWEQMFAGRRSLAN